MRACDIWGKGPERLADGLDPYPLVAHMLDTCAVAWALWDTWLSPRLRRLIAADLCGGDEAAARGWAAAAAGLHDIGKATPVFQEQAGSARSEIDGWRAIECERLTAAGLPRCTEMTVRALRDPSGHIARRHEYLGLVALSSLDPYELRQLPLGGDWLAAVTGGHHGRWHLPARDDVSPSIADGMRSGAWGDLQHSLSGTVAAACGRDMAAVPRIDPGRAGVVVVLLTGLTILADWVASSDRVVEAGYGMIASGSDPESPLWAEERADELCAVVGSTVGSYVPPSDPLAAVFGTGGRAPRPLQADAEGVGDGAWFVAYPTGEGKTEAALMRHMAGGPEGLIFGLPTRATTTAMQARLESVFRGTGNSVLLSHQYAAAHHVECASAYGLEWFSSSIRRLVAPVVAATCDQVLVGSLRQHHAALRLLALANHHVVLDEVHTYDQYQSHLLKPLLAWWGATGTRVTLLSATMPQWQRREFSAAYLREKVITADTGAAYPAHWEVDGAPQGPRRPPLSASRPDLVVELTASDDATADHVSWAAASLAACPRARIAVIRSTVDDAIRTASRLRAALPGVPVMCLHSRMTVRHRAEAEGLLARLTGPGSASRDAVVVVSTQVLEASLDIDFDMMCTDLAPAASLVQRAGRLWRSPDGSGRRSRLGGETGQRVMRVVARTRGGRIAGRASLPYFDSELSRVSQWLSARPRIRIPDDVQDFVDQTALDLTNASEILLEAEEIAAAARRIEAAAASTNGLGRRVAGPGSRCRYQDLVVLAGGEDDGFALADEDRMGTRFDDLVSGTYLLLGGAAGAPATADALRSARGGNLVRDALDAMVPVSGSGLCDALDEAARLTSPSGWEPASRLLAHARPVDAGSLAACGLAYDEDLGLLGPNTLSEAGQP